MNFSQRMRLIWIDAFLDRNPMLRRIDLRTAFSLSTHQATIDIGRYRDMFREGFYYDEVNKGYVRRGKSSLFPSEVQDAVLKAQEAVAGAFED